MERLILFSTRVVFVLTLIAGCSSQAPKRVVVIPVVKEADQWASQSGEVGVPVQVGEKKKDETGAVPVRKPTSQ
jgi:hypothetical protein